MEHQEKMGYRIRVNIPPVSEDLMAKFHNCDTGNVCDAMDRFGAMHHAIKPLDPGWTMVGRAVTVRTRPCDNLVIYKALDLAQPGDILVINVHGYETGASWGDFTSKIAKAKGLAGIVLDGGRCNANTVATKTLGACRGRRPKASSGSGASSPDLGGPGTERVKSCL